jgi:hypothetical protein
MQGARGSRRGRFRSSFQPVSALLTKIFDFFITFEGERSAVSACGRPGLDPNTAGRKPALSRKRL